MHRRSILTCLAAAFGALMSPQAALADYPERTVKIVVPFEAGGTVDAIARVLANKLNAKWKVPVIVENKPGAGNIVGAIANELDLDSEMIKQISIFPDFTTVDLPEGMPKDVLSAFRNIWVCGQKLNAAKVLESGAPRINKKPSGNKPARKRPI